MHRKISSRRFKNTECAFGISVRNQRINKKPLFFQDPLNNAKTNYTIESIHEPKHCHRKLHPYDIDTKNLPKKYSSPHFSTTKPCYDSLWLPIFQASERDGIDIGGGVDHRKDQSVMVSTSVMGGKKQKHW
jgi:hypothetical protein